MQSKIVEISDFVKHLFSNAYKSCLWHSGRYFFYWLQRKSLKTLEFLKYKRDENDPLHCCCVPISDQKCTRFLYIGAYLLVDIMWIETNKKNTHTTCTNTFHSGSKNVQLLTENINLKQLK